MNKFLLLRKGTSAAFKFLFLIVVCFMLFFTYQSYKKLNTINNHYFSNSDSAEYKTKQLECLARNIYFEAATEPFEGKVAVAQVTLNRVRDSRFPKSVCEVVYQKNFVYDKVVCQFSWYCQTPSSLKVVNSQYYEESRRVAKMVLLEHFRLPSLERCIYYHADYVNPGWNKRKVIKIGRHVFYE